MRKPELQMAAGALNHSHTRKLKVELEVAWAKTARNDIVLCGPGSSGAQPQPPAWMRQAGWEHIKQLFQIDQC